MNNKNTDDLINVNDFQSMELKISMLNTTSQTDVKDDTKKIELAKLDGSYTPSIKLVEFLDKGMQLEVPARACSKGHILLLNFKVLNSSKNIEFSASVRVLEIKPLINGNESIVVNLLKYDQTAWNNLQQLFNNRQEEINDFLKAVK